MKRLPPIIVSLILVFALCSCDNNKSSKEYYQGTDLKQLETFTSVTGIKLNIEEDTPESNSKLYNYLTDNNADGLGAILKYEAYLKEYGFSKAEDLSDDEITTYLMNDYIIVTGKFSPQSNVIQYTITIPNEKNVVKDESDSEPEDQENTVKPSGNPVKDEAAIYSEFCQMVDNGAYTEAITYLNHESLSLDYADVRNYYQYAKAMKLYRETEFVRYSDIQEIVRNLTEGMPEDFKDSAEIAEKINGELNRLIGSHMWKLDSSKVYLAYHLIISDTGDVVLELQPEKDEPLYGHTTHQLVYVNLENGSYYMLCPNYNLDIDHCEYAITFQPDYIALSKAWGGQYDTFAVNYTRVS